MWWTIIAWNNLQAPTADFVAGCATISAIALVTALFGGNPLLIASTIVTATALVFGMYVKKMSCNGKGKKIKSIDHLASVLKNATHFRFDRGWFWQYAHHFLVEVVEHVKPTAQEPMETIRTRIYEFTTSAGLWSKSNADIMFKEACFIKPQESLKWAISEKKENENESIEENIKKGQLHQVLNDRYPEEDEERKSAIDVANGLLFDLKGSYNALSNNCEHFVTFCLSPIYRVGYSIQSGTYVNYVHHKDQKGRSQWKPSHLCERSPSWADFTDDSRKHFSMLNKVSASPVDCPSDVDNHPERDVFEKSIQTNLHNVNARIDQLAANLTCPYGQLCDDVVFLRETE